MKKFAGSLALFALCAAAIYVLLVVLLGNFAPGLPKKNLSYRKGSIGFLYTRLEELRHRTDVDILFLGSSHTYRGFDSRIFAERGLHTFNLGSSAQSVLQTEVLLRRYLKTLRPTLIVWEVSPASLTSDGVESSLDVLSNDTNDLWSLIMAVKQNHIKVYNTLIYSAYLDLFRQNAAFREDRRKADDTYIDGGFVEKDPQGYQIINRKKTEATPDAKQFASFENCLSLIRNSGSQLIMVQAPVARSLYESYTGHDAFDAKIRAYGTYYNFNTFMTLSDSTHFYDSDHLNRTGVTVFNKALIAMLPVIR